MKKVIEVVFQSEDDLRNRVARLWQKQKSDEEYEFIFLDQKAEKEFEKLINCFAEG